MLEAQIARLSDEVQRLPATSTAKEQEDEGEQQPSRMAAACHLAATLPDDVHHQDDPKGVCSSVQSDSTAPADPPAAKNLDDDDHHQHDPRGACSGLPSSSSEPCSHCHDHQLQANKASMLCEALHTEVADLQVANNRLRTHATQQQQVQTGSAPVPPLNPRTVSQLLKAASRCNELEQRCSSLTQELFSAKQVCEREVQLAKARECQAQHDCEYQEARLQSLASEHEQLEGQKMAADQAILDLQCESSSLEASYNQQTAALRDGCHSLEDQVRRAAIDHQSCTEQKAQIQSDLARKQSTIDEISGSRQLLQEEITLLEQHVRSSASTIEIAERKCHELSKELVQARSQHQDKQAKLADALHKTEAQLAGTTDQLHQHEMLSTSRARDSAEQIQTLQSQVESLARQLDVMQARKSSEATPPAVSEQGSSAQQLREVQACQAQLAMAQNELSGKEQLALDVTAADDERKQLGQRLEQSEADLREAHDIIVHDQAQAASDLDAAELKCRELFRRLEDSKADLAAAQQALETEQQRQDDRLQDAELKCRQLTEQLHDSQVGLEAAQSALAESQDLPASAGACNVLALPSQHQPCGSDAGQDAVATHVQSGAGLANASTLHAEGKHHLSMIDQQAAGTDPAETVKPAACQQIQESKSITLDRVMHLEHRCRQQQAEMAELQEVRTAAVQEATELQDQVGIDHFIACTPTSWKGLTANAQWTCECT